MFCQGLDDKGNPFRPVQKIKYMAFLESVKQSVKEKANFTCCWCNDRQQKVEIHHIVPQAEGGSDEEINAAPLCSNCHTSYGGNPELRKEIRSRRDAWYKRCDLEIKVHDRGERELDDSPTLHSVMVNLVRTWSAIRDSLEDEIEYTKEICELDIADLNKPISEELDEAAELFDFKTEISQFISMVKQDDMISFRKAYRKMAKDNGLESIVRLPGIKGHDDNPVPFTSWHDVAFSICTMANTVLNLPFAIKSMGSSDEGDPGGPTYNEIIAQMQIEATYLERDDFLFVEYVEEPEDSSRAE